VLRHLHAAVNHLLLVDLRMAAKEQEQIRESHIAAEEQIALLK
jgi:hypothetical protein